MILCDLESTQLEQECISLAGNSARDALLLFEFSLQMMNDVLMIKVPLNATVFQKPQQSS